MDFQENEEENDKKDNRVVVVIDCLPDFKFLEVPVSPKWRQPEKSDQGDLEDYRLIKISSGSRDLHSKLFQSVKDWKTEREKLIETLRTSTKALERNSTLVSSFRILTYLVDMVGNLTKSIVRPENSKAAFLMGNATVFGFGALLAEKLYYSKVRNAIKRAIAKDEESFKKCIKWYEKTNELDEVIKSIFPYDIDTDIARQVNKSFKDKSDNEKIFMAIIASNGKRNLKLLRDEDFLKAADRIATTEAGKLWYHKTILKDVVFSKSAQYKEILKVLRLFRTAEREMFFLEACKDFSSKINMKTAIDVISICSCLNNILYGAPASEIVEKFVKSSDEECKKLQNVVRLLKPEAEADLISEECLMREIEDLSLQESLEDEDPVLQQFRQYGSEIRRLSSSFKDSLYSSESKDEYYVTS